MRMKSFLAAFLLAIGVLVATVSTAGIEADEAQALDANPSLQDTARLLGYLWGDGSKSGNVWDVNAPSGTQFLIEELVERHGGTFVDRGRLTFTLPAPYNWPEWTSSLPNDSSAVRQAVQNPHFLAAVMEAEASVSGQIYDQSACCVNGYTIGRLTQLRDLLRSRGYSTAALERFPDPNSGRVTVAARQWDELRRDHVFACTQTNDAVRIPGGTNLGTYGNLRWLGSGSAWGDVIRTDCTIGAAVPNVRPLAGSCTTSVSDNRLTVNWTFTLGSVVIRTNGAFAATVSGSDGSWSRNGGVNQTVTLRVNAFGQRTDVTCRSGNTGGGGAGTCTVAPSGSRVALSWNDAGVSSYAIRRNGSWVKNASGSSTTANGSTADSWVVRYRLNGSVVDLSCGGNGGATAGSCTITNQAGGVLIDWPGVAGVDDYQVRRNGSWVGEASGQSRFIDPSGSTNANYEIRYRLNGSGRSINCR